VVYLGNVGALSVAAADIVAAIGALLQTQTNATNATKYS
jgi:hypothetical protein